jgi:Ti-type conjugative transfer relaxase TraA
LAIYHLTAKVISRARGQSMAAAAAYRSGCALRDERYGVTHNYSRSRPAAHAEIMAPAGVPAWVQEREALWNRVEAGERRRDAQLARAIDIGLPVELTLAQSLELLRDYIAQEFVAQGMVADFCIRRDDADNPGAQILLTLREINASGFGAKMRQWNRKSNLFEWRAAWAERANQHLARAGQLVRIDHRTLEAQQSELTPGRRMGVGRGRQDEPSLPSHLKERVVERRRIAKHNGEIIVEDPTVALRALTRQRPMFTEEDLLQFLTSRTDDTAQRDAALAAITASSELVALTPDAGGRPRFTSRDMLEAEKSLMKRVAAMATRRGHGRAAQPAQRSDGQAQIPLSEEQRHTFEYVVAEGDIKALAAPAGLPQGRALAAARELWESQGLRVIGVALSRIAVANLQASAGIASRTLEEREQEWQEGREPLTLNHVVVVDGAEMIGLKQLERILAVADKARGKVVLLGDSRQLKAMGSTSPLQGILERVASGALT